MQKNIVATLLLHAVPAVIHWFQQRVGYVPFPTEREGISYKISIRNIIFKERFINIFSIAFKDMLEFNVMVKDMLPQVKVLFVFPLTYKDFLPKNT